MTSTDESNQMPHSTEPTVLDWFISLLRLDPIKIPVADEILDEIIHVDPAPVKEILPVGPANFRLPAGIVLALIAQFTLAARATTPFLGITLYLMAAVLVGWAFWSGDFKLPRQEDVPRQRVFASVRLPFMLAGTFFAIIAFLAAGGNKFTSTVMFFWLGALLAMLIAFWEGDLDPARKLRAMLNWVRTPRFDIRIDGWGFLFIAVLLISAFARFFQLEAIPVEMWSDQAEKLLDVFDVLNGEYRIYFPRNTGREPLQFYMAAATIKTFSTGYTYLTLKIGTALAGFLTLPYIYLFAREVGGKRTGITAMLLAGIAYWPNIISRAGLRFPLYPLFVAPAMYYLVRGLRQRSRNDFLLCGLAVGIGLMGYSPARFIPFVVILGVILFSLHRSVRAWRRDAFYWLVIAGVIALIVFIPLLRVAMEMPDLFLFRSLSRIAQVERAYPEPPLLILVKNTVDALLMFSWDNGEIWILGPTHRPALDFIMAASFNLGLVIVMVRYIRKRDWLDLYSILSIPVLLLPSILALAFPDENPAMNRASGAIVPVLTLAAIPLAALPEWGARFWGRVKGRAAAIVALIMLIAVSITINYKIVFETYAKSMLHSTWNTRDAGRLIRGFSQSIGTYDQAYVVAYSHWMDTRLVGIHAGKPTMDYAIWPDQIALLPDTGSPMLFLLNRNDSEGLGVLTRKYPDGTISVFQAEFEGQDFLIYYVP